MPWDQVPHLASRMDICACLCSHNHLHACTHPPIQAHAQVASHISPFQMLSALALQEPWEHYDPAGAISFFQWLPNWCSTFIVATEGEASWCLSNLSDLHPQLEMQLLAASFRKMDGSFRSRLSGALSQGSQPHVANAVDVDRSDAQQSAQLITGGYQRSCIRQSISTTGRSMMCLQSPGTRCL